MLETDDLEIYQSIKAIINYCNTKAATDCNNCSIEEICNCTSVYLGDIKIEYKEKKVKEDD